MGVMLFIHFPQEILTEDVTGGSNNPSIEDTVDVTHKLSFQEAEGIAGLRIPLENVVKIGQISVENRYMDQELWIYLDQSEEETGSTDFYTDHPVQGQTSAVLGGTAEWQGGQLLLKFQLDDIYECQTSLEQNFLNVKLMDPKEVYEHIIVIDPAWGGEESGTNALGLAEKDVTLGIVKKVKDMLDIGEIKVYYTRLDDTLVTLQERVSTVEDVHADFVISVRAVGDTTNLDKYGIGCFYNDRFFIPDFGNVQLADLLETEVVTALSGRADGLWAADADSFLGKLQIPAAQVSVGFLTNEKENELLGLDAYQEKAAQGIVAAIQKAYEILKGAKE
jgi:N-acetylmuramoyl-L-alanine amidase